MIKMFKISSKHLEIISSILKLYLEKIEDIYKTHIFEKLNIGEEPSIEEHKEFISIRNDIKDIIKILDSTIENL